MAPIPQASGGAAVLRRPGRAGPVGTASPSAPGGLADSTHPAFPDAHADPR